jgi:hypothetical protein
MERSSFVETFVKRPDEWSGDRPAPLNLENVFPDDGADLIVEPAKPLAHRLVTADSFVEDAPELGNRLGHTLGVYL